MTGKKYSTKEIYNIKEGVCSHYTKLYNTILKAYGIDNIKVTGYAKKITENNIRTKTKKDIDNENDNENVDETGKHSWTLAKIDGEWVPLNATWNLFDKKVPITHVFQCYGYSGGTQISGIPVNEVERKLVIDNILELWSYLLGKSKIMKI